MTMRNKLIVSHLTLPGWEIAQLHSRSTLHPLLESILQRLCWTLCFSMLYPCYIHMWPETHSPPILVSQCVFPSVYISKAQKLRLKFDGSKLRPVDGMSCSQLLATVGQCETIQGASGFIEDMLKVFWEVEQTGDNRHESFHLRGFDTNWRCWHICALGHVHFWLPTAQDLCPFSIWSIHGCLFLGFRLLLVISKVTPLLPACTSFLESQILGFVIPALPFNARCKQYLLTRPYAYISPKWPKQSQT